MARKPFYIKINETTELKSITERDARPMFQLIDSNRLYLRQWLPWIDYTRTVEDELAYIRSVAAQYQENQSITCLIIYHGSIAGTISYHPIDWQNRKVEIGYWLGAQFQGKGLMTVACQAMVRYAFENLKLNKVEIRCATGNIRSCAIPQRMGFVEEGTIRQAEWLYDHYVDLRLYGLLKSEWMNQQRNA
ncbi:ribosomal-protein-serine acetyltransferase [Dictyobacter alpinus]|uniref:Ribosomal-protein-serine acetyltransferase n=1 Tax=Dictyobacter alpinus TaxID=2014873 RepID=A0A402B545_9CHLR|nr:GNAT family N-acetyltransferase [Dictyobacter alpinus]GCE26471.1 ribosomal-protein-serine acetyltransferase [Dictyobacter alpinus]